MAQADRKVRDAKKAVEIASAFLKKAGVQLFVIRGAKLEGNRWIVEGMSWGKSFTVVINRLTGKIAKYASR